MRLAVVAVCAALSGAATPTILDGLTADPAQAAPNAAYVETHLLFGTARPDGGPDVTEGQFQEFVNEVVSPRFPAGLSVDELSGQWRNQDGTISRERSYDITLLYPAHEAAGKDAAIEKIREDYKHRFAQESVGRVDDHARVDF